jgi:hypothetical protein
MHHERSERHVRADRAYPLDDHRERRGRVLLLGKGAVLTQRVAGPLAAELDDEEQPARHGSALATSGDCSSRPIPTKEHRHHHQFLDIEATRATRSSRRSLGNGCRTASRSVMRRGFGTSPLVPSRGRRSRFPALRALCPASTTRCWCSRHPGSGLPHVGAGSCGSAPGREPRSSFGRQPSARFPVSRGVARVTTTCN